MTCTSASGVFVAMTARAHGRYSVRYMSTIIGVFQMQITSNGAQIHNSPLEVKVHPGPTFPSKSIADGLGLTACQAGVECGFNVYARDERRNQVGYPSCCSGDQLALVHRFIMP